MSFNALIDKSALDAIMEFVVFSTSFEAVNAIPPLEARTPSFSFNIFPSLAFKSM